MLSVCVCHKDSTRGNIDDDDEDDDGAWSWCKLMMQVYEARVWWWCKMPIIMMQVYDNHDDDDVSVWICVTKDDKRCKIEMMVMMMLKQDDDWMSLSPWWR